MTIKFSNINGWLKKGPGILSSIRCSKKGEGKPRNKQVNYFTLIGKLLSATNWTTKYMHMAIYRWAASAAQQAVMTCHSQLHPNCLALIYLNAHFCRKLNCVQLMYSLGGCCLPNSVLGLMGPSGSSKTLLLSTIGGRPPGCEHLDHRKLYLLVSAQESHASQLAKHLQPLESFLRHSLGYLQLEELMQKAVEHFELCCGEVLVCPVIFNLFAINA